MLRIFKPILQTALIYIDDILLYSVNEKEHIQLLQQFQSIISEYGIMLSARKMVIAQPNIEFLGMQIADGNFKPQAHLATALLDFPDENLTRRQVQQFLGVINYVSEFIPQFAQLTRPLQKMLTRNPPQWAKRQTDAVKSLKLEIQRLPPLKIPSTGTRILQTDASDKYWGAILFEEENSKRQICGYRSGRFKDSETHYHSTFKEILAVKRAIEKFEFHLIGHKFRIEMDMSSFPKMLQFKQKMVPHQQLLRWSEWFSKYDFESFYLKDTKNTLADMLSRNPIPEIQMMASSSGSATKRYFDFASNMPEDAHQLINGEALHEHLKEKIFHYQSILLSKYGINSHYFIPLGIHPDYPFGHLYRFQSTDMPEEVLCFLWYLCSVYTIGISFDVKWLYQYVNAYQGQRECFSTFLTWFAPLPVWSGKLRRSAKAISLPFKKLKGEGGLNPFFNPHTIYFFHRPVHVNTKSGKIHALPTLIHHNDYHRGVRPDFNVNDNKAYEEFQLHAFRLNNSRQNFPVPFVPNWIYYPTDYQMSLDEDLQYFLAKPYIPEVKRGTTSLESEPPQGILPEYLQDSQLPDDSMSIDEIGKMFGIQVNEGSQQHCDEPEMEYDCPGNEYGCCDKHIIKFEMDH